jgi:hypothetical protein
MSSPFYDLHPTKVAICRIIQVWLFHDTLMVQTPSFPCNKDKSVTVSLDGPQVQRSHLEQILDPETHAFKLANRGRIVQQGHFDGSEFKSNQKDYMETFTLRFISYMLEKEVDLSFCCVDGSFLNVIVPTDVWQRSQLLRDTIIGMLGAKMKTVVFQGNTGSGNQRGVRGRACGAWYPEAAGSNGHIPTKKSVAILMSKVTNQALSLFKKEAEIMSSNSNYSIKSIICTEIKETKKKVSFVITSLGDCCEISKIDLVDLFADTVQSTAWLDRLKQSIIFAPDDNIRNNSLIADGPEGARLLSVLASERRKDNFIRLQNKDDEIDINIPRTLSINNGNKRWKRKGGNGTVYVPVNSVCSAVLPLDEKKEIFACCANTLELRGGACKVEGVTLLPPGRLFCSLALLSFGINPQTCSTLNLSDNDEKTDDGLGKIVQDALSWTRFKNRIEHSDEWRVKEAIEFNMGCLELGETLESRPDKIQSLCAFFDGVNGPMDVWEGYDTSLEEMNASLRRKSKVQQRGIPKQEKKGSSGQPRSTNSSETRYHHGSNTTFICPGCNDAFSAIEACKNHMQSCCFGLVRNQDPLLG